MRKVYWTLLTFLLAALAAGPVSASGIARDEQGAAAAGQAGAFAARADDPSAIYYNPAGIVQLDGTRLMVGANGYIRTLSLGQGSHGSPEMEENFLFTPEIYFTHKATGRLSFGVGLFDPFAQQVSWQRDWPGRFISRESRFRVHEVNPTIAFKMGDWSIAAGGSWLRGDMTFKRNLDFSAIGAPQGLEKLTGDASDWRGNAGIRYGGKKFQWGLTWRSSATLQFDNADVSFDNVPANANALLCGGQTCYAGQNASVELKLPQTVSTGFAIGLKKWKLELDAVRTDWKKAFDRFVVDYGKNSTVLTDQTLVLDWKDTWSWKFGAALPVKEVYELRAGIAFDENPVPDATAGPIFPEGERLSVQAGYGYAAPSGRFRYDAYARWADQGSQRSTVAPIGTYDGNEVSVGLSGTWIF